MAEELVRLGVAQRTERVAASIAPARRGETLGIADFVRLLQRSGELPRATTPVEPPVAEVAEIDTPANSLRG